MNNSMSYLIGALEGAWQSLQEFNTETPDVVIVVGTRGRRRNLLGHFCPNSWHIEPEQIGEPADKSTEKIHEVLIVAEALDRGAQEVFQTLMHESVHAIANKRGIKDVIGQAHNKKFRNLAEEIGMSFEGSRDSRLGFSHVVLTDELVETFEPVINHIDEALQAYRRPELQEKEPKQQPKYGCDCERTTKFTKKFLDKGPVICGVCNQEFSEVDE